MNLVYLGGYYINGMRKFSFIDRIRSFKYAFKGIVLLFKDEHNAWIHGIAMLGTLGMGAYFKISNLEWIAVIICIGIVLAAEAFNSAIEQIADFIQPNQDQKIERIKDLAAGGVLLSAISAFLVGIIIFLPKIINYISK